MMGKKTLQVVRANTPNSHRQLCHCCPWERIEHVHARQKQRYDSLDLNILL